MKEADNKETKEIAWYYELWILLLIATALTLFNQWPLLLNLSILFAFIAWSFVCNVIYVFKKHDW